MPEHFADDAERLKRFEREAKTLAALDHSNVAQIFGVDRIGDIGFLVLELVPGESLRFGREVYDGDVWLSESRRAAPSGEPGGAPSSARARAAAPAGRRCTPRR